MKKINVVETILNSRLYKSANHKTATAFAPTNIALCKYWGKRNQELNLPRTSSLSISLADKGAETTITISDRQHDVIVLNGQTVDSYSSFSNRLIQFLDLFRKPQSIYFDVDIQSNIPIAAGLASSACGFAAVVCALNQLFAWKLNEKELSILARLGSGSASRSIWQGFVEWHAGIRDDGMDSFVEPIFHAWPELCIGLMMISTQEKPISSRIAMQRTVETSALYSAWPEKVEYDMEILKHAIHNEDFGLLGRTAESNALAMHATMLSAWPPIQYCLPETLTLMQNIWQARADGLSLYFTQDAGPNLKCLFLKKDRNLVREVLPSIEIIEPFTKI